jgi:hypothetical protein
MLGCFFRFVLLRWYFCLGLVLLRLALGFECFVPSMAIIFAMAVANVRRYPLPAVVAGKARIYI